MLSTLPSSPNAATSPVLLSTYGSSPLSSTFRTSGTLDHSTLPSPLISTTPPSVDSTSRRSSTPICRSMRRSTLKLGLCVWCPTSLFPTVSLSPFSCRQSRAYYSGIAKISNKRCQQRGETKETFTFSFLNEIIRTYQNREHLLRFAHSHFRSCSVFH